MDISKLMQQAGALQKQLEETGRQINEMEFEAEASNGLVKVTVNGENKILSVSIDETILNKEDKEMIEDLIMIAVNNAISKVEEYKKEKYGAMGSAMGLPF
ncbi:MAG: YbaB/EbfC family nucleoid-associated protein [Erysipelotrichaceae bacterium]|nr:YbaB/EbfC family nucleoid-associated protein [Erysipelotrichaceae bacterium]